MTNEEKINLRERALRLSEEMVNPYPPELGFKLAEEIYQFLSKGLDDDPLRLGEELKCANEYIDYLEYFRPKHEIDWSRPQLVVSNDDETFVVRTNGVHISDVFQGFGPDDGDSPDEYKKKWFKYHGEIPEADNQKIPASQETKTTGLNFLQAMRLCKAGKNVRRECWNKRYFLYHSNFELFRDDARREMLSMEDFLATDWQIVNH